MIERYLFLLPDDSVLFLSKCNAKLCSELFFKKSLTFSVSSVIAIAISVHVSALLELFTKTVFF